MTEEKKNEVAIFEQIRTNVQVADRDYYKVPMAMVFGKGSLARTESFGGKSLVENSQKVDLAIQNTNELQNIWNHSHSQWMWKHLNLSYHAPHKNMRQIAAEMNRKKAALNEAKWRQVKNEIKIKKIEEELQAGKCDYWREVDLTVKLTELREGLAEGIVTIEGAMKDVLVLNELYEQLKAKVSDFSEIDIEMEESKTHLKRSIVQSIRDVRMSGAITKAEQEYLEQIGVNPMKMQNLIRQYVKQEAESTSWDNKGLYDFVDDVVKDLIDNHKVDIVRMEYMGFDSKPVENMSYDTTVARRLTKDE
tara:strand:- start:868 stop:1785 length:918 start_codon:yes stop_codon:yes gene_type:complete